MRALICVRRLDRGGAELLECRLAGALNAIGVETHLACQYGPGMEFQEDAARSWLARGVPAVHWIGMDSPVRSAAAVPRLRRLIARHAIDAIITTTHGTDIVGRIATATRGAAHVIAFHDYPHQSILRNPRIRVWAPFARRADGFYSISNHVRRAVQEHFSIPRERNQVVYNSIEQHAQISKAAVDALRAELAIPAGRRLLVSIGRIQERKGCDILIDALAPALKAWNACLVMVGAAFHSKAIEQGALDFDAVVRNRIASHDAEDRVLLVGYRADSARFMAAADVFVHLPRHEGFGLVLLEAIVAGTPVVASAVGGIPEVLAQTPYTPVALEDTAAIRQQVEQALRMSPQDRECVAERARSVLPFFSDSRRAAEIAEVLEEAVRRRRVA